MSVKVRECVKLKIKCVCSTVNYYVYFTTMFTLLLVFKQCTWTLKSQCENDRGLTFTVHRVREW